MRYKMIRFAKSALGELRRAAGGFEAVLLALSANKPCIFKQFTAFDFQ